MHFLSNQSEGTILKASLIVLAWTAAFWFSAFAAYGAVRDCAQAKQATQAAQGSSQRPR